MTVNCSSRTVPELENINHTSRNESQPKNDEKREEMLGPSSPGTKSQPHNIRLLTESSALTLSERKVEQLEKENSRLKTSIQELVTERVYVGSTLFVSTVVQGDPILPLEILYLIGQFVVGDNNYRSLANYSLACRVVRQELRPVLFETVVYERADEVSGVRDDIKEGKLFKDTKYLIVSESCGWDEHDFPNLVVVLTLDHTGFATDQHQRQSVANIRILKPVHIATLYEILRIPLSWSSLNGRFRSHGLVRGLRGITIDALQSVHGDEQLRGEPTSSAKFGDIDTTFVLKHQHSSQELRKTITQLLSLVIFVATSRSGVDDEPAAEEDRNTPRLHFRVKEGGGAVARLVNEIDSIPRSDTLHGEI
ncbi:hypothetical protein QFC21_006071 [Naganishia friedmannii]|uniref:Uncharacterized protein n=1 Tax=Naganishia friedmannii TaxID=89922 RepID=A0ACC2V5Q5_9TREE|nr:hypothetical protein QFC21_006071 [Naganishia friedmannii]